MASSHDHDHGGHDHRHDHGGHHHGRGHGHHHIDPDAGDRRVLGALAVNMLLTLAQIAGGIVSGSLSLIADALHNFSDAISLGIAFAARKIARRPTDETMTFGYGRAEVVAALINYTTLIVIGLYLLYEGVLRLIDPQPVEGWVVVIVAGIALAVDLVTAALTHAMSKHSMNIRAAFLHNVADALGSVGVIVAGTLIILFDWRIVDALVTLLIAGYVLVMAFREISGSIRMLMLATPADVDAAALVERLRTVPGVLDVHHLHVWAIDEGQSTLEAHVVVDDEGAPAAAEVKRRVKAVVAAEFGIGHATLELESGDGCCDDAKVIGH